VIYAVSVCTVSGLEGVLHHQGKSERDEGKDIYNNIIESVELG
jgi:hypothetical protein